MKLGDFRVGMHFSCGTRRWVCTDIGTRVVVAILYKEGWMAGPPYAVGEVVFDEDDMRVSSEVPQ